jgi:uncharacterized protein YfiM (DUF2279 family)
VPVGAVGAVVVASAAVAAAGKATALRRELSSRRVKIQGFAELSASGPA